MYVCGRLRAKLTDTHSEGPASRAQREGVLRLSERRVHACVRACARVVSDCEPVRKGSVDFDISQCLWQGLGLDMGELSLARVSLFAEVSAVTVWI